MKTCLNCGIEVPQTEGRRERKFCSEACRQKKWQQTQRDLRKTIGPSIKTVVAQKVEPETPIDPNAAILKAIAAVKAELTPPHRNTLLGRKVWAEEQQKRIIDLESKLK